jgi:Uma2 family endonuclease
MTPMPSNMGRDPLASLPTQIPKFVKPFASAWHQLQVDWLIESLNSRWGDREDFHCNGHVPVYYKAGPNRTAITVVPDFFVVVDTESKPRDVWTVWEERGMRPHLAIDVLETDLEANELQERVHVYEKSLRLSEYFVFDRRSNRVSGFCVGRPYRRITPNASGRVWSDILEAWLGHWTSPYCRMDVSWLRLFDSPNPEAK